MADYATLLRDHVTLTCRSVDRIFLQAYVPKLQSVGRVCQFLRWQKGFSIPSSAAFGKIGDAYVAEVYRWAKKNAVPVRRFAKGENKEQIARPLIEAAAREGGDGRVVLIGIAQERPRSGARGRPRAKSMWHIRTWSGVGRWALSTTSTFICGIPSGVARSGRPTPMPPGRCGSGSTGTLGRSGNATGSASVTPPWTTAFVTVRIPWSCSGSVTGSARAR
ncbi:Conserved protein of unknown function (part1) [Mycobacterium canettii CIPT 140070010]|nr:Conserved protein of unknown function (part1) [Mycobacterium canettii CIPT 140070010]